MLASPCLLSQQYYIQFFLANQIPPKANDQLCDTVTTDLVYEYQIVSVLLLLEYWLLLKHVISLSYFHSVA